MPPTHINSCYDAVIIGAGVAGALIAVRLREANFSVLILEAGDCDVAAPLDGGEWEASRLKLVERYVTSVSKTLGSPYFTPDSRQYAPSPDSAADYDQTGSPAKFTSTYERRVGGTTWHWLGTTPRFIPADFEMHQRYGVGVDWPLSYFELEPWYCKAEEELGVAGDHEAWNNIDGEAFRSQPFPMERIWPSYGDLVVNRRLDRTPAYYRGLPLTFVSTPQARNSRPYQGRPACAGNSTCVPLCPIGAKYDATVHIRRAVELKAHLSPKSVVTRLEVGADGLVKKVKFRPWGETEQSVSGRVVILAAHAVESAKLLLLSSDRTSPRFRHGLANTSRQVGRNLMDHLQGFGAGLMPEPVFPLRGPLSTSSIETLRNWDFRHERSALRLSLSNDGWNRVETPDQTLRNLLNQGFYGEELRQRVEDRFIRQVRLSYTAEMLPNPNNRVSLGNVLDGSGMPNTKIHFEADEYTKLGLEAAWDVVDILFNALGVTDRNVPRDRDKFTGAGHIMGTCRMGRNPRTSVVSPMGRSHDCPNLFLAGASVFPTCGTANPTLTVAALALRTASEIVKELNSP